VVGGGDDGGDDGGVKVGVDGVNVGVADVLVLGTVVVLLLLEDVLLGAGFGFGFGGGGRRPGTEALAAGAAIDGPVCESATAGASDVGAGAVDDLDFVASPTPNAAANATTTAATSIRIRLRTALSPPATAGACPCSAAPLSIWSPTVECLLNRTPAGDSRRTQIMRSRTAIATA